MKPEYDTTAVDAAIESMARAGRPVFFAVPAGFAGAFPGGYAGHPLHRYEGQEGEALYYLGDHGATLGHYAEKHARADRRNPSKAAADEMS